MAVALVAVVFSVVLTLLFGLGGPGANVGFRDCSDCPEMVDIPHGTFMMGGTPAEHAWYTGKMGGKQELADWETPRHTVRIDYSFAVGKFEVTRGQYAKFAADTARSDGDGCHVYDGTWKKVATRNWHAPGWAQTPRHPVACVSWDDATAYVKWLSKQTGFAYRLLSEAEFEYVARATTSTTRYWGDDWENQAACRFANAADAGSKWRDAFDCADGYRHTAPVGEYQANAFGLYDMLGNVSEWTADCWNESFANAPTDGSAWLSGNCHARVLRGGSWSNNPRVVRAADRDSDATDARHVNDGFRVARTRSR